ncbi:roadblock/LC7 domain-containing protein [Kutzneria sp. CA-103260]|uniref:roadblock/LC7 domain-containing protein n=1 Tax=Kutzneria sp. CA-103260 TaxID=2802641 RepID=UPI001BA59139|nr:roadblock/LC7 domain-containing protein [Kutzneria sp. CA-103260]QUQ64245.1 roadblock/LC7 family protein [Kutzneria sp. CA-103260]
MDHDALGLQLHALREKVAGVTDTVIAAADGLLIAADAARVLDLDCISALAAADLGLARRTTAATSQGSFRHTVVRGSGGCMALYAVGNGALITVLGDEGLDIGRLHIEAQPVIERIGSILSAR